MFRRQFVGGVGAVLGSSLIARKSLAGQPATSNPNIKAGDWKAFRDLFPLNNDKIQLATFLLASHPKPVSDEIEKHRRNLDHDIVGYLHAQYGVEEKIAAAAAQYMGGRGDQIALTDSTTMGLAMVYSGLILAPGDEVLHTTHDHYSTFMSLQHRAERTGAIIKQVALYDNPAETSVDEVLARLESAIRPATKVVAVTWVHSSTGVKLPIRAMADRIEKINRARAADRQIIFCVDGVHGFGIEDQDISELGCDFFIAGTHKWLFGPRGTGVIWGSDKGWEQCRPVIPSFGGSTQVWLGQKTLDEVPIGQQMTPGGFHAFEHRWALPAAFELHRKLGKDNVQARIHELNTQAKQGLLAIPNVTVHTPVSPDLSSGLVCFDIQGMDPRMVAMQMYQKGVVMTNTPYHKSHARLAPSLLNSESEIERAIEGIRGLAGV